jgi:predicted GTPase
MAEARGVDVQAQRISEGLKKLSELLDQPIAREALDLSRDAESSSRYDIFKRLRQSLRQYLERDGDLFYVGLLGHFSAGKSSTINSLLGTWSTTDERATGLNPTDDTITLITQAKNSNSLLGVIREGHVTIRHKATESPVLASLVLVDTPGTGDPQLLQEIARDFLPICDVILFLLSAASPLDKSDLPLLSELHKRLQFIPIFFVVTRADELRSDFSKPLTEENMDQQHKMRFLNEVVSRINSLLQPLVYETDQIFLVDNRTGFNVEALREFLNARCNSASAAARVSMHTNKLHYYLSGAKELRDFFAGFLNSKLTELNKIVAAAARNIQKYQENVNISNNNLTKAWLDHHAAIDLAKTRALEPLKSLDALPEDYSGFPTVIKKRADVLNDLRRDAAYSASSIQANLRVDVISRLQDHFYRIQKAVADTEFDQLGASSAAVQNPRIEYDFNNVLSISPLILSRRYDDLRESQADALREAASDLRSTIKDVEELLQSRAPFADCEAAMDRARESLTKDLSQFFQNVELYRSGVFSHTTKESISTLGIGHQLDELESEFNEDDKAALTADAVGDLFPGFNELTAKAATQLANLSGKVRALSESSRVITVGRPDDSSQQIREATVAATAALYSEILRQLHSDVDRLCGSVRANISSLIVNAKADYDKALREARAARRRRYLGVAAITGLIVASGSIAYFHYNRPAPESTFGAIALHVVAGLIVEAIVLAVARWRENVPKRAIETQERFQVALNDNIRKMMDAELKGLSFDALNETVLSNRLTQMCEHILSENTDAWHGKAAEVLRVLRALYTDYRALRSDYVSFINETHQQCTSYFSDASKNLEILNTVAKKIKESAIEPSFALLDKTQKQLEYVRKDVEAIDFT